MIQFQRNPLPPVREAELDKWMKDPQGDFMREVVHSKIAELQCEMSAIGTESPTERTEFDIKEKVGQIQFWKNFLDAWDRLYKDAKFTLRMSVLTSVLEKIKNEEANNSP